MVLHKNLVTTNLHVPKDHTHVEADITDLQSYLTLAAGDLRYEPIGGAGGAYLPLAGGIMTGDIVFAFGEYLVGTTSGAVTKAICGVNALDECFIGHTDLVADVVGSAARPTYNSAALALFSDVGAAVDDAIPHYSKGSGDFNAIFVYNPAVASNGTVKVSCRDLVLQMQGGVASPSYNFSISKSTPVGAGGSDPTAQYVTFTAADAGVQQVYVEVSDGTTTLTEVMLPITVL